MLTPEERALATNIGDRLIALYGEREEAITAGNLERLYDVQEEIVHATAERRHLLDSEEAREALI